jgi:hypothetical protein
VSAPFVAALLAPLPEGEDFDAQAFLDQCASDERVTRPGSRLQDEVIRWIDDYASRNPDFYWPKGGAA